MNANYSTIAHTCMAEWRQGVKKISDTPEVTALPIKAGHNM